VWLSTKIVGLDLAPFSEKVDNHYFKTFQNPQVVQQAGLHWRATITVNQCNIGLSHFSAQTCSSFSVA